MGQWHLEEAADASVLVRQPPEQFDVEGPTAGERCRHRRPERRTDLEDLGAALRVVDLEAKYEAAERAEHPTGVVTSQRSIDLMAEQGDA